MTDMRRADDRNTRAAQEKKAKADGQQSVGSKAQDKGFLNAHQGLLDDCAFSKGAKHLLSEGVHDSADEHVREAPGLLHPSRGR